MKKERIIYFDFLRIFAALAVIMLHTAGSQYSLTGIFHYSACLWDGLARWGVPIFVMISGALFLEPAKQITMSNLFKKYIFHIAVLFIVWSSFYTCISCVSQNNFNFIFVIEKFIDGYYHLWFLYMIAGLYLITPILRAITEKKDKNLLLYLLIIWFVMASVVPFISFIVPQTEKMLDTITNFRLHFSFPLSFVGYFVLGYYLHNYMNIKNKILIISVLFVSFLLTVLGDIKYSVPSAPSFFLNSFSPFVIITAMSIFLFMKNSSLPIKQSNEIILKLSDLTLGVYLVHPFFIKVAEKSNLFGIINSIVNDNMFFTIPIIFVAVGSCSFITAWLLSKIPIVKKYCL